MKRTISPVTIAYLVVCTLFAGTNAVVGTGGNVRSRHFVEFQRNPAQTVGGLVPNGLWQPDYVQLKRHVSLLSSIKFLRELGDSVRLALGQSPDWVFWGGHDTKALFLTGELWVSRGLDSRIENEVERIATVIGRYNNQLEHDGWKLVIVPVPTKLGIHHDWARWPVGGADLLNRDPVMRDRSDEVYQAFRSALDGQGVTSVDLLKVYRGALAQNPGTILYPPSESHWSGVGIRLAAAATAHAISTSSLLKERSLNHPTFYTDPHIGDLAEAFDPLPWLTTRLRSIWVYRDQLLDGEEGRGYPESVNPAGLVVVLGTSYTGQYTWIPRPVGFTWQLGLHLDNVEIQNRPMAGQGSFKSFEYFWGHRKEIADDFIRREGGGKVKVVVWEMPIRDIPSIGQSALSWTQKDGWH